MRSLAAFIRAVTKQVAMPLLSAVAEDKLKMAKIEENYDQFIVEYPFDDGKKKVEAASTNATNSSAPEQQTSSKTEAVDARL
jgi:hypothetical protein